MVNLLQDPHPMYQWNQHASTTNESASTSVSASKLNIPLETSEAESDSETKEADIEPSNCNFIMEYI